MKKVGILCLCWVGALGLMSIEPVSAQKLKQPRPKEIRMDRNYDGVIDRVEVYDEKGIIIRVEADTTGDGKMNEWIYYKKGNPTKAEKDVNGDGKVDTFLTYDDKGMIIKSETDTNRDGKINEWVSYKNGKPIKAEKDTKGDGKPDTWITY